MLFPLLGGEFMPKLEEGNFWIRATLPMSISLDQSREVRRQDARDPARLPDDPNAVRRRDRDHPEVVTVVSQLGRPDDGTDVAGFYNIEFFAPLKPFDEWPHGLTKEKLTEELSAGSCATAFPGVVFNFSQYISDNVEEAISGVKGENSVKVFGPDLETNEANAEGIVDVMSKVPGVEGPRHVRSLGQPSIEDRPRPRGVRAVRPQHRRRRGVVQAAIGGQAVTQVYEGEKFFDLTVRWKRAVPQSLEAIREITVSTPDGAHIPLGQIATITPAEGPRSSIARTACATRRSSSAFAGATSPERSPRPEAGSARRSHSPYDTHLEWAGEINELKEAKERLRSSSRSRCSSSRSSSTAR